MRPTADNPRRSADRHRAAKRWPCVFLAVVLTTASLSVPDAVAAPAPAGPAEARDARSPLPTESRAAVGSRSASRAETLWIFDADFEDFTGDNAGWTTYDLSETLARINYWHKDTIRINGFTHLGDNTWWCGAYNSCWRQPRGYGNDWTCSLSRSFPEIAGSTDPGDPLFLEYDQRFAMENCYDYGYVDISTPGDTTWTTIVTVTNEGGCGGFEWPGLPKDWDSTWWPSPGHMLVDLSAYSGAEFQLRFRFESDASYSSQDQYDNSLHSMLDGAWQLDNITLWAETPGSTLIFLDDCELPGDNGWAHDDLPAMGQTGVVFSRMFEPDTHRGFACDPRTGWMMAAVDAVTGRMVDGQYSWLMSPPIDISGVSRLVGQWDAWIDAPEDARDIYNLYLASTDDEECVLDRATFVDEYPGWQYGGPFWGTWASNWDAFAGNDWLAIEWAVQNTQPPEPGADHMGGIFLARQRVGIPIYLDEPRWSFPPAKRFYDTFDAGLWMEAEVYIASDVGIASVDLVATNDGGATWDSYPLQREPLEKWEADVPANQMVPGVEILYYFTATDSAGGTSLFPADAPDDCFEFSVLPINASAEDRGILLVDKSAEAAPGDDRAYRHESEYYFREALDILGYEYDVYDALDPGTSAGEGPYDPLAYEAYDTHLWFMGDVSEYALDYWERQKLTDWLSASTSDSSHNLLLMGDKIAECLTDGGTTTSDFLEDWVGASYQGAHPGQCPHVDHPDTMIRVRDIGLGLMTFDDGECWLQCACPELRCFDVVDAIPGSGAERALEYDNGRETYPVGTARTDSLSGYRVVYLPFGIEFMNDGLNGVNGHYRNGIEDRVDLMGNIMEYFGKTPMSTPTGVDEGEPFTNRLGHARPNPFNPSTTIEFSLGAEGRATIRVFDCAGRVIRTLVNAELEAGSHTAVWNGTTDAGEHAASGVYFVRMETIGPAGAFREARKVVLLK